MTTGIEDQNVNRREIALREALKAYDSGLFVDDPVDATGIVKVAREFDDFLRGPTLGDE